MKKSMIHLAGWAALLVVGVIALSTTKTETETRLKSEAAAKLTQAGVTGVTVTASGQDLVLNGKPDKIAAAQAALKPDGFWTGPVVAVRVMTATTVATASPAVASESVSATQSVSSSSASTSAAATSSAAATVAEPAPAKPLNRAGQRCQDRINSAVAGGGIGYRFNAYELTPQGERTMREVHRVLKRCPAEVKLTITGYTDNVGADEVNKSLSAGRAVDAMNALTAAGWPDDKVTAVGAGSADPVASNATAAGRKKNRRVVFTLSSAS
ncbi:inner membrane lipoprotein yiaD [Asticcacaulis biprosthecium C19]|uniref:Inner membrane lipoprotein yiaD n=1 Tax=Asticcacaulis biprosthecium C19 TaxID=715226 RepID=F4QMB9_9CAUL|nr:OmpA family protein [Asticcacaulis biprosthecium]EGF91360.1 inner membrane lipoprotein yiaD [Asticcacaulis biprosthecium C19]